MPLSKKHEKDELPPIKRARKKAMSKAKPDSQEIFKIRSPNYHSFYILFLLFGGCVLFYYLGKLVLLP